ncbi:MAG: sigma factor [Candidatus Limivicinus sp.]|nr:sigma factor [Candidatus Limivicinus sp.]
MLTEEQFCALAKKHMDMIFRIAFNYLKDQSEADDITRNVLLKLLGSEKGI